MGNILLAFLAAFALSFVGVPPILTAGVMIGSNVARAFSPNLDSLLSFGSGSLAMAVQTEVWVRDIEEELYAGNEWITRATNDTQFVNNKTVHIPRSGGAPTVLEDYDHAGSGPVTPTYRTDTTRDYNMGEFVTTPTAIPTIEEAQTSYSKRMSVLREHINVVNDRIALRTVDNWATGLTAADIYRTTGAATALLPSGATAGTRNKLTIADFAQMQAVLNAENLPQSGRVCVLPSSMLNDLVTDTNLATVFAQARGNQNVYATGVIANLFGFDIYVRSRVILMDTISGTTRLSITAAASSGTAAADAAMFFHSSQVRYARGATKAYMQENHPEYYGDVMSIGVLHGSASTRSTEVGIKVLAQGGTAV